MQCIPLPDNPIHSATEIRLDCSFTQGYDCQGFSTYPDRQGWTKRTTADWAHLFDNPPPKFVAFLERWLFFGFAQSVFSVEASSFITCAGDPAYPVLTTEHLPALVDKIRNTKGVSPDVSAVIEQALRMHGFLALATTAHLFDIDMSEIRTLPEFIEGAATKDPRRPDMAIATSILFDVITVFSGSRDYQEEGFTAHHQVVPRSAYPWTSPVWKVLREDGWCPSQLSMACARSNTSSLWFLHHLSRPSSDQEHPASQSENRHGRQFDSSAASSCTTSSCKYRRLNDATYKSKHTKECSGCEDVASSGSLCSILNQRKIPLISALEVGSENANISLKAAEPGCDYIAISHVWSDGLGNIDANAIPRCQLVRLSQMVREVEGTAWFWLDTLCVPPDKAKLETEQLIALELMRPTYEGAKAVLVLDSWTVEENHQDKSDIENLHKVFFCAWNTRLWTFQEGALAKTLLFRFRDGAYNVDEAIDKIRATKVTRIEITVKPGLIALHDQLRGFRKCIGSNNDLLRFIVESLAVRSTSVSGDEPLCLAALLDLDVKKIAETESDLRMREFWRMLGPVPAGFVFQARYTKLNIDGFQWAPKSLLGVGSYSVQLRSPGLLRLGDEGLLATGPGLRAPHAGVDIQKQIWLTDGFSNWYRLDLFLDDCSEAKEFELPDTTLRSRFINVKEAYGCDEVGFIHESKLFGDGNSTQDLDPLDYGSGVIAMVAIKHDKGGRAYGRYVCCGTIQRVGPDVYKKNGEVLQQLFEQQKIRISPEDLKSLNITPDNSQINSKAGNLDFEQIRMLAEQGELTVTRITSRFVFDKRSKKVVAAICKVTSTDQKWCIG